MRRLFRIGMTAILWIAAGCMMLGSAAGETIPVINTEASSWIVNRTDPTRFEPYRMIDGDETTSFQFSTETTPLGRAYLFFDFAQGEDIDTLLIKNGFWRYTDGLDQYVRNSRIRQMKIDFRYAGEDGYRDPKIAVLPDDRERRDWTAVDLGLRRNVDSVRIMVQSIYVGTAFPTDVCVSEIQFVNGAATPDAGKELWGLAIDKLATRTGPSTLYEGGGTYSVRGQYIRVLSRAFDSRNGIWWVKCEIPYGSEIRVLWTGYKRFDADTLPLEAIPVERF